MVETEVKTADLCDEHASELEVCYLDLKSYGGKKGFFGPISTVKVFEDNVLVKEALQTIPEGSVLVVDGGGSKRCALLGDRLGDIAQQRKLAGVIINGCVRDTAELAKQKVGILALGSNPLKSIKKGQGERDITLQFGEVRWQPGHYVYADEDGVVLSAKPLHK
ncbi:ribonuclease E activity regulator RraA [Bacillus thermotolerans]|uniref:4-hydroxy-4-methyl-2-oxoglutarate aldolase n=1 Tax=Bacillus thermotolerans TaxID=1221996 RepID=A0A0F5I3R7_BACTR|nr:ribonuclease E activity regulator RraA [Bacillus thermotolerans]KKB40161.1 Ribonuclease E inhibitor RraA [Bacillus thermotolerans]KKB42628.1 Ribonuclease E inhibitor RraA [Bacillus thermotolerans]